MEQQTPIVEETENVGTIDYATPQTPSPEEEQRKQDAAGWFDGSAVDSSWMPTPDISFDALSGIGDAIGSAASATGDVIGVVAEGAGSAAGAIAEAAGEVVGGILEGISF